jgi:hypothetical protein
MSKIYDFDEKHPGFLDKINAFLTERRPLGWIVGHMRTHWDNTFQTEDLKNYIAERWKVERNYQRVATRGSRSGAKRAAAKTGANAEETAPAASLDATEHPPQRQEGAEIFDGPSPLPVGNFVDAARPQLHRLLEDYRENPDGDAGQIVNIMLLNQLVSTYSSVPEVDMLKLYEEERKRKELEQRLKKFEVDKFKAETHRRRVDAEVVVMQSKVEKVRKELEQTRKAIQQGQRVDPMDMVRHISSAIGVGGPLEPRVEG